MDEQFTEEMFEEVDMKKDIQYCLTEIPDLGDIGKFASIETDEVYDKEFWEKVADQIRKENKQYEEQCKRMQINPISGKSTMSWEDRNRMFNL